MTVKYNIDNDDTPLRRNKQVVPPSQRTNDEVDVKDQGDDLLFYSPELQSAILASSLEALFQTYTALGTTEAYVVEERDDCFNSAENLLLSPSHVCESVEYHQSNRPAVFSQRRVRFSPELVTEVRTRPRTLPEDLGVLFYTYEETQRFRSEYRAEREGNVYDTEGTDESLLLDEEEMNCIFGDSDNSYTSPSKQHKYDISRVVIRSSNGIEMYDGSNGRYRSTKRSSHSAVNVDVGPDFFFDNDSFWSGSITWY